MEQQINNVFGGQIAANDIYNIYIKIKDNDLSNLTLNDLFDVLYTVKAENKEIIRRKYFNIPTVSILLIALFLFIIIILHVNSILINDISTNILFSRYELFIIVTISFILFSVLSILIYSRTKYLHPILVENNKIIYELELEIQKRQLRG